MMRCSLYLLAIALLFSTTTPSFALSTSKLTRLKGWKESAKRNDHEGIITAFLRSCYAIDKRQSSMHELMGNKQDWLPLCENAAQQQKHQKEGWRDAFLRKHFTALHLPKLKKKDGLFTGYYIPSLKGSWKKTQRYRYPIYPTPPTRTLRTSYTHQQIAEGALDDKVTPLLYVDNPVDLFFLHIQGSGQVTLKNGETVMVGYDGKNGKSYHAIGRTLVDEGLFTKEEMNGMVLKEWLYAHPKKAQKLMYKNRSYVFFRLLDHGYPIGAQAVPVTPMRSLAVDRRHIPLGSFVWLDTEVHHGKKTYDFRQLMIAQDTGGAIKGIERGDIFFGVGKQAESLANMQKHRGDMTLIVPKSLAKKLKKKCKSCH